MKNLILKSSISAILLATSFQASAEMSANFGAASTYLWRGVSLSDNSPQVSGGIDYANDSGVYAGFWQSSESNANSTETDFYVGFSGEAGSVGYDVGFIAYKYLQNDASDFNEVYVNVSFGDFGVGYALDSENSNSYINASASFDKFTVTIGSAMFDDSANDYTHFDVSYDVGEGVAFTFSKNDIDGDDKGRFVVSWTKDIDMK